LDRLWKVFDTPKGQAFVANLSGNIQSTGVLYLCVLFFYSFS
jgi:hypothetical protein